MENFKHNYKFGRISSEFTDCALPLTADTTTKCSFGCQYCFAAQFASTNPACKKSPELKLVNPKSFRELIMGKKIDNPYYQHFYSKRFILHIGGLTDCFDYIEKKHKITLDIIKTLLELHYPTLISTKGLSMFLDNPEYMKIFEEGSKYKNFAFQLSIVTNSDEISKKIEPNTPSTSERLSVIKKMSELGYYTILRLRPFIIGITDIGLEELLTKAKQAGAKAISTEFFAIDERAAPLLKERFKNISNIIGFDILPFYKKLSPTERGTYLRLNRDVKEIFMKRIYITCKKLGLGISISDPDFKELNYSGCCCGLPDEYPINPELTNFSKGQITFHLKELRKRYWISEGKDKYLKFEDIEKTMWDNWATEYKYYGDSIKYWQVDYAQLKTGHIREFINTWNNLNSGCNPYSHYQGILKPIKVDERGLLIYEYSPRLYEFRWKKEGIL